MNQHLPLILISNDDGYNSKGILALIDAVRGLGEIVVMAPDGPRSGAAGAITTQQPLRVDKIEESERLTMYKCSGTPVDCTKLALHGYVPRTPDIILSGINHGDNSSVNVHYSGTMGVVIEGCLKGIPSVGFSLCEHDANADFTPCLPIVRDISERVIREGLPQDVCLNVNFPKVERLKGVRVCRQTRGTWLGEFEECRHSKGSAYYWMTGEYHNFESGVEGTDHWALDNGFAAITPTHIDVTAYEAMSVLKSFNQDL